MANKRSQYDLMNPLFNAISSSDLSSTQRWLLMALYRFMDGNGVCHPSYKKLVTLTGLSRATIASQIKELAAKGWISYESGSSVAATANTYHLNLEKIGIKKEQIKANLDQQTDKEPVKRIKGRLVTERDAIAGGYDWIDEITGK